MRCQEIRQQLAVYRELGRVERERVQDHIAGCPSCSVALDAYRAQDQLLSTLPVLSPSPALAEAVRARTVGRGGRSLHKSWRRAAAALTVLLILSIVGSTIAVAADSLPGDWLFPVKRGTERVRLALTWDRAARERYQHRLSEARREEVRQVVRLERSVRVEFEGELLAVSDGHWVVQGLSVEVSSAAWSGTPPPTGTQLWVAAQASAGQLRALHVRVLRPPQPTPEARTSPVQPSPDLTATSPPTATFPATATQQREDEAVSSPTRRPELVPTKTRSPIGPGPGPSVTPSPIGPGPGPSVTPGPIGPGPGPSVTPSPIGPGPGPSVTPSPIGPGPGPSVTPTQGGPGPRPSATPRRAMY